MVWSLGLRVQCSEFGVLGSGPEPFSGYVQLYLLGLWFEVQDYGLRVHWRPVLIHCFADYDMFFSLFQILERTRTSTNQSLATLLMILLLFHILERPENLCDMIAEPLTLAPSPWTQHPKQF